MSFVIQNFYQSPRILVFTPRVKLKIILNNLNLILTILKIQTFFNAKKNLSIDFLGMPLLFIKFFFTKGLFKRLFYFNAKYFYNYTNNYTKSVTYWNLKFLNNFLSHKGRRAPLIQIHDNSSFNSYYHPIKNTNQRLNNNYYRNFFFYIMFTFTNNWFQFNSLFKIYLNFIFINKNLQMLKIYNGPFFKIYNF